MYANEVETKEDKKLTTTYMFIIVEYIKTHTVVICRFLSKDIWRRHHGCFRAKVLIVGLTKGQFALCNVHQSKCSDLSLFSHGRCQRVLSRRNVLNHRSRSADVICNVLEIRSNLKFGRNSWPSYKQHY